MASQIDDWCHSCGWAEPEKAELALCPDCGRTVCLDCRDRKGRCAACAPMRLPKGVVVYHEKGGECWDYEASLAIWAYVGIHWWAKLLPATRKMERISEPFPTREAGLEFLRKSLKKLACPGNPITVRFRSKGLLQEFFRYP